MADKTVVKLSDGQQMPLLGLGTSQIPNDEQGYEAIKSAINLGYRHIDTAAMYGNEQAVGRAVRDSGVERSQLFITTKLNNHQHGNVEREVTASLQKLGLDYVDLYLIHWPMPERVASWQTLTKLVKGPSIRSIGVSNFTIRHLEELAKKADTVPAVDQVEFSPFLNQTRLLKYANEHHIQLVAYSPLTRASKLGNPVVTGLAQAHGKTPAQVMLRWTLQQGVAVIPKANKSEHQKSNLDIFDWQLTADDMQALAGLHQGFRITTDPESFP